MSRILLGWEMGSNLVYLSRLLPLASLSVARKEWSVKFRPVSEGSLVKGVTQCVSARYHQGAMRIRFARGAVIGLVCALMFGALDTAKAASFSCDGSLTAVGKMICHNPELSALDVRLSGLYSLELAMGRSRRELRSEQRAWLKEKRSKCNDEPCLTAVYRKRIEELNVLIQKTATSLPALVFGEKDISDHCPKDRQDAFFLKLQTRGETVAGYIDGSRFCADKLLGSVALTGRKVGKVALVQFDPRWMEEDAPASAEAMIAVAGRQVFWVILSEINVQSLIPEEVDHLTRVRRPAWDAGE